MRIIIITSILFFSFQIKAQEIKIFQQEVTSLDKFHSIDDWKQNYLNMNCNLNKKNKTVNTANKMVSEWEHNEYSISYKNIPIEYSMIKVHKKNGIIKLINGEYYEDVNLDILPKKSEQAALEKVKEYINADEYSWESNQQDFFIKIKQEHLLLPPKGKLVICSDYLHAENKVLCLAYKFEIYATKPLSRDYIYIDASTLEIIHKNSIIKNINASAQTRYSGTQTISTQSFNGQYRLHDYDNNRGAGIVTYNMTNAGVNYAIATDFLDTDNNWTSAEYNNNAKDNAALDAHWGAMMTYDYFKQIHGRNSFDNQGSAILSYVHYGNAYDNAFWNGSVMTYGDGGTSFDALTSLDIAAHEIGHGVTTFSANLVYAGESGAINEGMSDIWGACVENFVGNSTNIEIWSIGEDIDIINQTGMRQMYNPTLSNQPFTFGGTNWFTVTGCTPDQSNDKCGVHTNSGVFNYWFYLLSKGGSGVNDNSTPYSVSGISIAKSEQIVYKALTEYFTPNTNFGAASILTSYAAQEIFGFCSEEVISNKDAWKAVGVNLSLNIPINLTVSTNIPSGTTYSFLAVNTLTANNIIETNTNITYKAGNKIILTDGFHDKAGSNFHAYIEPCANNFDTRQLRTANSSSTYKQSKENISNILKTQMLIYPNPSTGVFNINFNAETTANIVVYDVMGKLILEKTINNTNSTSFDLAAQKTGIYILKIVDNNGSVTTERIVKQ